MLHSVPASQVAVQLPPLHARLHCAFGAHVSEQFPPGHAALHTLLSAHVNAQLPAVHEPRSHWPPAAQVPTPVTGRGPPPIGVALITHAARASPMTTPNLLMGRSLQIDPDRY